MNEIASACVSLSGYVGACVSASECVIAWVSVSVSENVSA